MAKVVMSVTVTDVFGKKPISYTIEREWVGKEATSQEIEQMGRTLSEMVYEEMQDRLKDYGDHLLNVGHMDPDDFEVQD